MTHPSEPTPAEEPAETITVSCPSCGWTHHTNHLQVAERLRAYHRGASVRAAGFHREADVRGRQWDTPSRRRAHRATPNRVRWGACRMTLDRVGLGVVAALVEGAATRNDLPRLIRYADAVRALPDAAQLATAHEATRQRDARAGVRYPASHVAVELGRLVDRWGPSIESET